MINTRKKQRFPQTSPLRFFPTNESKHNQSVSSLSLLHDVIHADYEHAALIIDSNPLLIFERVHFSYHDGSSEHISPLQYACKVYDTYMWRLFYEKIRNNLVHLKQFLTQAQQQTTHINLKPLALACKEFAKAEQKQAEQELDPAWFQVGKVQRALLPAHMLKEFSREGKRGSWSPHTEFHAAVVPPPTNCLIYDYIENTPKTLSATFLDWDNGASFALVRSTYSQAKNVDGAECAENLLYDLKTFQCLLAVRAKELANKLSFIKNSLAENKQDQFTLSHFPYKQLPYRLMSCIDRFLDDQTLSSVSQAMGHFRQASTDPIMRIPFQQKPTLPRLLHDVIHADYEHAALIIDINPALIFENINFLHLDGSFEHISPLRYAFKVYDTYMWKLFYEKIKDNPTHVKLFLAQAQQQTTHINLGPLSIVYKKYAKLKQPSQGSEIDIQEIDALWFKIGKMQRALLPAHLLKEFSREEKRGSWSPRSEFHAAVLPPPTHCLFYNGEEDTAKTLPAIFSDWDKGASFALIRGPWPRARVNSARFEGHLLHDLETFQHLLAVRAKELAFIKNTLHYQLPDECLHHIDCFLDEATLSSMNQAMGHARRSSTDPMMQIPFWKKPTLPRLLRDAIHADYEHAALILSINPSLIFEHVNFFYRDGRSEYISPLKYAFKVYDTKMWTLFYEKIKDNPIHVEQFIAQAQQQTTHINLEPLCIACIEFATHKKQYQPKPNNPEILALWLKLCKAQKATLPAHMLKEASLGLEEKLEAITLPAAFLAWENGITNLVVARNTIWDTIEDNLLHDLEFFQQLLTKGADELAVGLFIIKNPLENPEQQLQSLPATYRAAP